MPELELWTLSQPLITPFFKGQCESFWLLSAVVLACFFHKFVQGACCNLVGHHLPVWWELEGATWGILSYPLDNQSAKISYLKPLWCWIRVDDWSLYHPVILYWALILLSSKHLCVFGLHGAIYVLKFLCLHPSLYLLVSWAWWDWPLTWLTNHHPSVLWHCWLGHLTRKTVSEMTYSVSSGTLNTTIPYHPVIRKQYLFKIV